MRRGSKGCPPSPTGCDAGSPISARALAEERSPAPFREVELPTASSPLLQGRATRLVRQLRSLHDAVERWQARSGGSSARAQDVAVECRLGPGNSAGKSGPEVIHFAPETV